MKYYNYILLVILISINSLIGKELITFDANKHNEQVNNALIRLNSAKNNVDSIRSIIDLSFELKRSEPYKAIELLDIASEISSSSNHLNYYGKALSIKGNTYKEMYSLDSALYLAKKSLEIRKKYSDSIEIYYGYINIANIYSIQGDIKNTLYYLDTLLDKLHYRLLKNSDLSLMNYLESKTSIDDNELANTRVVFCEIFNTFGTLLLHYNNSKAFEYSNTSLSILKNRNESYFIKELDYNLTQEVYYQVFLGYTLSLNDTKLDTILFNIVNNIIVAKRDFYYQQKIYSIRALHEYFQNDSKDFNYYYDLSKRINYDNHDPNIAFIKQFLEVATISSNLEKQFIFLNKYKNDNSILSSLKISIIRYLISKSNNKLYLDFYNELLKNQSLSNSYYLECINQIVEFEGKLKTVHKEYVYNINNEVLNDYKQLVVSIKIIILVLLIFVALVFLLYESRKKIKLQKYRIENIVEELEISKYEIEKNIEVKNKIFEVLGHNLRNPISAFNKYLSELKDNYKTLQTNDIETILSNLIISTNETHSTLENLLIWTNINKGEIKVNITNFNLQDLVKDVQKLLNLKLENKSIELKYFDTDYEISTDRNILHVLLTNYIDNAIKFSNLYSTISISRTEEDGFCIIKIEDNGLGIEPNKLQVIQEGKFIPSTLGTKNEKGNGLGLQICFELIELINGNVYIESEVNKGTTVLIYLPTND